jgi:hypothetical protein
VKEEQRIGGARSLKRCKPYEGRYNPLRRWIGWTDDNNQITPLEIKKAKEQGIEVRKIGKQYEHDRTAADGKQMQHTTKNAVFRKFWQKRGNLATMETQGDKQESLHGYRQTNERLVPQHQNIKILVKEIREQSKGESDKKERQTSYEIVRVLSPWVESEACCSATPTTDWTFCSSA